MTFIGVNDNGSVCGVKKIDESPRCPSKLKDAQQ